ncbi:outer membrane protein with beta-barrel domain [Gelidibacter sediminis]|uniref:Outer membrane protein with beta-barrel domain n=1 Tax=Gelidibacter sediminis TaxID=1608710 RepID=A0A4R7Q6L9_9FLAO|nr:porin family protein [Gelidibacter sediminis]TDU43214.1 outer membrane protein with beta-barrel domain [Gelidibacter sediminis]
MRSAILFVLGCGFTSLIWAQQVADTTFVDQKYREDQFYFSLTYNLLGKVPNDLKQSGFSSGVHFGVIRDMPINARRNKAVGIGLGLSTNSYNQNVLISKGSDGGIDYDIIDERIITIKRNKFTTYTLEMPLQYRWRTSTAVDYKFWRIYTGIKLGYVFYNSSKFTGSVKDIKLNGIEDFNGLQYGLTLSAGYSTWNFHVYYGLNTIFKDTAQLNGQAMDMNSIKIGLMFYIL